MESRVKKLARQAANLDEKGKELFIHDFIVGNVKYDKLKKEYSHEIIGALGNGVAVCEGIAKAVKILCDYEFTAGSKVRIMPDVHTGKGCTIGTTMTVIDKAVPNVVGVDIGCVWFFDTAGDLQVAARNSVADNRQLGRVGICAGC